MLRELMDPEDYRLIIPMSSWNGIRGATTLPKDIWEKTTRVRHAPKSKRTSKSSKKQDVNKELATVMRELDKDESSVSSSETINIHNDNSNVISKGRGKGKGSYPNKKDSKTATKNSKRPKVL